MTFDAIVDTVMKRLNLTSDVARARIGEAVNERYKKVTSSIGLDTSRRVDITIEVDPQNSDFDSLPELTIQGVEKVIKISLPNEDGTIKVLSEVYYEEITTVATVSRLPRAWAVKKMGAQQIIVRLDSFPETPFTLKVEGFDLADELADDAEPYFPESFHDILIEGAKAEELLKMEKPQLAAIADGKYEARLSDLRMFIAMSIYRDIYQGKNKPTQLWYRPWLSRLSIYN
jgi:hypothetical protein